MKNLPAQLPPHALEIEEIILGSIMIEQDAMQTVLGIIPYPETFYIDKHRRIYQAILNLFHYHQPIDIMTVTQQLKKDGDIDLVGGAYSVMALTERVNSAANIEQHCRIIQEAYIRRMIIASSQKLIRYAYDETKDTFVVLEEAQHSLMRIVDGLSAKKEESLLKLIPNTLKKIENTIDKGGITGIPTGYITLDEVTGGWQPSDLIILAARPGQGKTTLVMNMARNSALDFGKKVAIFSLEMASEQLAMKLIASEIERSTSQLTKGKVYSKEEISEMHRRSECLITENIIIDDTARISINQIKAKAHKYKAHYGIEWIIIDYLQLISSDIKPGSTREQEISSISRGLKMLSKELSIPIVALSQLSRAVEQRGGEKRPQLSDLRESGSIEQDADIVLLMLRYEYYGMLKDENGNSLENKCEILIAKHRNGKVCVGKDALILGCNMKQSKFYDLKGSVLSVPEN